MVSVEYLDTVIAVRFATPHRVLSWAIHNGGQREVDAVAWVGVRNADLPVGVDPRVLVYERLERVGLSNAVGLLTSRDLSHYVMRTRTLRGVTAGCVATVGFSNALRVGEPPTALPEVAGTINVLSWCSAPLDANATLEALSLAVEARTLAVVEAGVASSQGAGPATGTGTDCVVIASPASATDAASYAGKHTVIGHLLGAVTHAAVAAGARAWVASPPSAPATIR